MPGTLELLPREQVVFQRMLDTVRGAFERFGFLPIETPALEYVDVLLSKEGGETARQVYFVQSTGAREQGRDPELALRIDLTVPLARYVAEHEHELAFPFRRYQIQRVYRGERAQKGRYREFYQCDIDVVGKDALSIRYDAEMPAVIHRVFTDLGIGAFTIRLNNRKLLRGVLEAHGLPDADAQTVALREIDKLDKRGRDHVAERLREDVGLAGDAADRLLDFLSRGGSNEEVLAALAGAGVENESFSEGHRELRTVIETLHELGVPEDAVQLDLSIARGLDYYTGTVYETILEAHPELGSICSGGRYDDLASQYTKSRLPGVGISIGFTRLFYQLREAGVVQADEDTGTVLVTRRDPSLDAAYLALATALREAGVPAELYLDDHGFRKQMKYAHKRGARLALIVGEDEHAKGVVTVKDMLSGEQSEVPLADAPARVAALLG
jgi:histidyl-tRNA synthetase